MLVELFEILADKKIKILHLLFACGFGWGGLLALGAELPDPPADLFILAANFLAISSCRPPPPPPIIGICGAAEWPLPPLIEQIKLEQIISKLSQTEFGNEFGTLS